MSQKLHSWHSSGGSETEVTLEPGVYALVSHQAADPRVGAAEPPQSLETDNGLSVSDADGNILLAGPGGFQVKYAGAFKITFGEPRVIELWNVGP